jgi:hypothetical protein
VIGPTMLVGQSVFVCGEEAPLLAGERDAIDLIGELFGGERNAAA